tara:strand:- start:2252 stop:2668 length:417 start_codon:yes stop_codon:yes gene_type:complete
MVTAGMVRSSITGGVQKIKTGAGNVIAGNPAVAGTVLGVVAGGAIAGGIAKVASGRRKRAKTTKRRRKSSTRRIKKHTHRRAKRRIVRGRGLGRKEIHHGHKGNKVVSFRNKKTGKMVRFKVRGTAKRHTPARRRKRR